MKKTENGQGKIMTVRSDDQLLYCAIHNLRREHLLLLSTFVEQVDGMSLESNMSDSKKFDTLP